MLKTMEVRNIKGVLYGGFQKGYSNFFIGLIALIILILGGVLFLVASGRFNFNPGPKTNVIVRLNWLHQAQYAGMYVALEKGFYEAEGLVVTLKEFEEGLDQSTELSNGVTDFAISTPTELIAAIDNGGKIKAVAAIYQVSPQAIASLKSKNILSPSDFEGKVLGSMGGNNEALTKYSVLSKQFGVKNPRIVDLGFDLNEGDHLLQGTADTVDLYRVDQPYLLQKKGIDYNLLLPENFGLRSYGDVIITSNELIDSNPELVRKFVDATLRGWEYVFENIDESLEIVALYQSSDYEDAQRQKFILEQSIPLIRQTGGQKIGSMNFLVWNQALKAMESASLLTTGVNTNEIYTSMFVNSR